MWRTLRALTAISIAVALSLAVAAQADAQNQSDENVAIQAMVTGIDLIEPLAVSPALSPLGGDFAGDAPFAMLGWSRFFIEVPGTSLVEPPVDQFGDAVTWRWPASLDYFANSPYLTVWTFQLTQPVSGCASAVYYEAGLFFIAPDQPVVPELSDRPNDPGIGTSSVVAEVCIDGVNSEFFGLAGQEGMDQFASSYPALQATVADEHFITFFAENPNAVGRPTASGSEDLSVGPEGIYFHQYEDLAGPIRQLSLDDLADQATVDALFAAPTSGSDEAPDQAAPEPTEEQNEEPSEEADETDVSSESDPETDQAGGEQGSDEGESQGSDAGGGDAAEGDTGTDAGADQSDSDGEETGVAVDDGDSNGTLALVGLGGALAVLGVGGGVVATKKRNKKPADAGTTLVPPGTRDPFEALLGRAETTGLPKVGEWQQLPSDVAPFLYYDESLQIWIMQGIGSQLFGAERPGWELKKGVNVEEMDGETSGPPPPPDWNATAPEERHKRFAYWCSDRGIRIGSLTDPFGYDHDRESQTEEPVVEENEALMATENDDVRPT